MDKSKKTPAISVAQLREVLDEYDDDTMILPQVVSRDGMQAWNMMLDAAVPFGKEWGEGSLLLQMSHPELDQLPKVEKVEAQRMGFRVGVMFKTLGSEVDVEITTEHSPELTEEGKLLALMLGVQRQATKLGKSGDEAVAELKKTFAQATITAYMRTLVAGQKPN